MDAEEHVADIGRTLRALQLPDDDRICWCGREKQDGEDHAMCYPGVD